jgi:hypothetical protein
LILQLIESCIHEETTYSPLSFPCATWPCPNRTKKICTGSRFREGKGRKNRSCLSDFRARGVFDDSDQPVPVKGLQIHDLGPDESDGLTRI